MSKDKSMWGKAWSKALELVIGIYQEDPNFGKVYVVNRGIEITTQRPKFDDMILGEFNSLQEAEAFVFEDTRPLDEDKA